jgi:hypothetical protein
MSIESQSACTNQHFGEISPILVWGYSAMGLSVSDYLQNFETIRLLLDSIHLLSESQKNFSLFYFVAKNENRKKHVFLY